MQRPPTRARCASLCLLILLSSCDGGDDDEPVIPRAGSWSGDGIAFEVSDEGGKITIDYADYGSCAGASCWSEAYATCESCSVDIEMGDGPTEFFEPTMACEGTFVSATRAEGSCAMYSECGCTMTHEWVAELE